jgi:hypothetical protein
MIDALFISAQNAPVNSARYFSRLTVYADRILFW